MVHHVQRFGLLVAVVAAVMMSGGPACAEEASGATATAAAAAPDSGTPGKDAGAASAKAGDKDSGAAPQGGGRCTGKATFCGVYSRTFCSSQPGCAYMTGANMCGGIAVACDKATNETFCKKIKGCSWK